MENLKNALCSYFQKEGTTKREVNANGYLHSFLDNVYGHKMIIEHQQMFDHGSGGELHSKAEAVHSSSMLGYNFFSWINEKKPFFFDDVTYTKVYFEVQLRTLCCRSNPANMDIVLDGTNKDGKRVLLFIESKFLEYTNFDKMELSDSYIKPENYYVNNPWNKVAESLIEMTKDTKHYNGGLKQSFCHLVALNALEKPMALTWFNKNNDLKIENLTDIEIRFMNAIFCPSEDYKEYERYCDYEKHYKSFKLLIETKALYSVQPQWFSYSQIWKEMEPQLMNMDEAERVEYIKRRYMDFAKKC